MKILNHLNLLLLLKFLSLLVVIFSFSTPILPLNIGPPSQSGIYIFPTGFHTNKIDKNINFKFFGISYKNIHLARFENSFKDPVISLGINRLLYIKNKFTIGYTAGLLHGYKGKLSNVKGIPLRKSFLFTSNINPVIGLSSSYKIHPKIHLATFIEPLVIIYGIKFVY